MSTSNFLQFHTLTSYSATLLNRDDAGFAKRMPFGGAMRTRVSSQCLKRHWRTHEGEHGLDKLQVPESVRSRVTFEEKLVKPLVADGVDQEAARAVVRKVVGVLLGGDKKEEKQEKQAKAGKKGKPAEAVPEKDASTDADRVLTDQVVVLGEKELGYLLALTKKAIAEGKGDAKAAVGHIAEALKSKDAKNNLAELKAGAGLSAALFGRMVTGDILARVDAAIHVAHAMTVHEEAPEADYFSALDDILKDAGEAGSGHINSSELTSGLFYGFITVDVPLLVKNLGGGAEGKDLAGKVVQQLVQILPTVSPGAKKGGTAPYAYAHLLVAEAGPAQPRTFANAFLEPVKERPNVVFNAYDALNGYAKELKEMYGTQPKRVFAGIHTGDRLKDLDAPKKSVAEVASWAKDRVAE